MARQPQILKFRRHLRQRERAPNRAAQILRINLHLLPVPERLTRNPDDALVVGHEVVKHRRGVREEVDVAIFTVIRSWLRVIGLVLTC